MKSKYFFLLFCILVIGGVFFGKPEKVEAYTSSYEYAGYWYYFTGYNYTGTSCVGDQKHCAGNVYYSVDQGNGVTKNYSFFVYGKIDETLGVLSDAYTAWWYNSIYGNGGSASCGNFTVSQNWAYNSCTVAYHCDGGSAALTIRDASCNESHSPCIYGCLDQYSCKAPPPSAPIMYSAGGILACGATSYTFSWSTSSGANSYGLHILDDDRTSGTAECTGTDVCVGDANTNIGTSYTVTLLKPGHSYKAKAFAYSNNSGTLGAVSTPVSFSVPATSCNCISQNTMANNGITTDKYYQFGSSASPNLFMQANGNGSSVILGLKNSSNNQSWGLATSSDGYYYSLVSKSGGVLDQSGSSIVLNSSSGNDSQKWCFQASNPVAMKKSNNWFGFITEAFAQSSKLYTLVNKGSGFALTATTTDGTSIRSGTSLMQKTISPGSLYQSWSVQVVAPVAPVITSATSSCVNNNPSVKIDFDIVSEASSYKSYRCDSGGSNNCGLLSSTSNSPATDIPPNISTTTYSYYLKSVNSSGIESASSSPKTVIVSRCSGNDIALSTNPSVKPFTTNPTTVGATGGKCGFIINLASVGSNSSCKIVDASDSNSSFTFTPNSQNNNIKVSDNPLSITKETQYKLVCWENDPVTNNKINGTETVPKYATCYINPNFQEVNK